MVKWTLEAGDGFSAYALNPFYCCKAMRSFAFTLVELLIALALSLLLLLAVTALLSRVGGAMNEARSAMSASNDLHTAAILLRQDLARIPNSLTTKPARIAAGGGDVSDNDGYLEIIEGPNTLSDHPFVDADGNFDVTVGDVDDIIAFMVRTSMARTGRFRGLHQADFRGLIVDEDGELRIAETEDAEIVWFVRGNTLYRRVRLVDVSDVSERARRENRLLHAFRDDPANLSPTNSFPYPLYCPNNPGWRYLRVPTLEENLYRNCTDNPCTCGDCWSNHPQWKTINLPGTPVVSNPDLWEQPHFFPSLQDRQSGSLQRFVSTPRNVRTGEDVVLTNVLSFDVKVWCPDLKEFVDLGTPGSAWEDSNNNHPTSLPRTWDSWTQAYVVEHGNTLGSPPYIAPIEAIQITIRNFDPASRAIKQVTVVHRFGD